MPPVTLSQETTALLGRITAGTYSQADLAMFVETHPSTTRSAAFNAYKVAAAGRLHAIFAEPGMGEISWPFGVDLSNAELLGKVATALSSDYLDYWGYPPAENGGVCIRSPRHETASRNTRISVKALLRGVRPTSPTPGMCRFCAAAMCGRCGIAAGAASGRELQLAIVMTGFCPEHKPFQLKDITPKPPRFKGMYKINDVLRKGHKEVAV